MELFEKIGIAALVVVVALLAFVYIKYIKGGDPLDPSDKDWKKTRDEELTPAIEKYNLWLQEVSAQSEILLDEIEMIFAKMIKQMWNDGGNWWRMMLEFFSYIGKCIAWNKWRYLYIIILLVLFGLVLHYVFGV